MTEDQLYTALVELCQDYGTTCEETYERLHSAIATIYTDFGDDYNDEPVVDVGAAVNANLSTHGDLHPPVLNSEQTVLVTGNPSDGFAYIGPFDNSEDAFTYADQANHSEWWASPLDGVQCDDDGNWVL